MRKSYKPRRKVGLKKARRVIDKVQAKKRKQNSDTMSLLCKSQFDIVPQQGLNVSNYISQFFSLLPDADFLSIVDNADFTLYRNLYDRFRVNSMLVQWTPRPNVLDQVNAQADTVMHLGDNLLHYAADRDGRAPSNIGSMMKYSSYFKIACLKKHSRKYSVSYPRGIWLDTSAPTDKSQLSKGIGLQGGISVYGENFVEDGGEVWNEPLGTFTVWWRVVFQGKTSGKISYNEETQEVCIKPAETLPLKPVNPIYTKHGTIADTRMKLDASGIPFADPIDETNDVD